MKSRKLLALGIVLAAGVSLEIAYGVRHELGFGPAGCRILSGRFYGPSFSFDKPELSVPVDAATGIRIVNSFGAVRVERGDPGVVRVSLRVVVYAPGQSQAASFADRVKLGTEPSASGLSVGTNRDRLERETDIGFETHLRVLVPEGTAVEVEGEYGPVSVEDAASARVRSSYEEVRLSRIGGPGSVDSRYGPVSASDVTGSLTVSARHDDVDVNNVGGLVKLDVANGDVRASGVAGIDVTVSQGSARLDDVQGDLDVRGTNAAIQASGVTGHAHVETSYDGVTLRDVAGAVWVSTKHAGVEVSNAAADVSVEASYDDVRLETVAGAVVAHVSHGGLTGLDLRGGAQIEADDDVELTRFGGALVVSAQHGSVALEAASPLRETIEATSDGSDVSLRVPAGSALALEASSETGSVDVSLDGFVASESSPSRIVGGVGGGGPHVLLRARRGDVVVTTAD